MTEKQRIPLAQINLNEIDLSNLKQMHSSDGQGIDFFIDDSGTHPFGAGLVIFKAGSGVDTHIHEGAHILEVQEGEGMLGYYDEFHELKPGMLYNIPSNVPHSIEAITDLVLKVIGNDYRSVESKERLVGGGSMKNKKI